MGKRKAETVEEAEPLEVLDVNEGLETSVQQQETMPQTQKTQPTKKRKASRNSPTASASSSSSKPASTGHRQRLSWTAEEEQKLWQGVMNVMKEAGKWKTVADYVGTRDSTKCQVHMASMLNKMGVKGVQVASWYSG
ncbi:hypothetical protein HDV00_000061 [Rhizophlyctis rosea]|nr:hypothetical protein HDV00_000061 [Rhizophlyctis rosea]